MGAKSAVAAGFDGVGVSAVALWAGIFAGPAAVAGAEFVDYVVSKWTCTHQTKLLQGAVTAAAFALALTGLAVAWRELQRVPAHEPGDGSRPLAIARFMAMLGVAISVFAAVTIVAFTVPQWVLDACQ